MHTFKYKKDNLLKKLSFIYEKKSVRRAISLLTCFSFLLLLCSGCTKDSSPTRIPHSEVSESTEDFDAFLDELFLAEVSTNTINLHYTLSDPSAYGITNHQVSLGEISQEEFAKCNARYENYLSRLKSFNYNLLTTEQQLSYDVLYDYISCQLDAADFYLYDELLRPSSGIQAELPILFEEYNFYQQGDIDDYLELISLVDTYFEQIVAYEKEKSAAGLFMSDTACNLIISECEDFTSNTDSHYLIETFNNKVDRCDFLSENQREEYKLQNESIVKDVILPAYEYLADELTLLLGSGENDLGLCYFPEGKEYYEYLVYYNTGCSDDIEDIEKMISDARSLDLIESADLMEENPDLWEKCSEVTLPTVDSTTTLETLKERMLTNFPSAPDTSFTVSYIEECMADYLAPAFYITAPIDNYSNNSIFINADIDTSDISYFTTLAHEGYPGHLYQTVMSYEANLPNARFILNYPGYIEGWATYIEMMSYSYAGLDENVASLLEKNQSTILSLYATTDIGIHYEGWTYDDTLQFWTNYGITNEAAIKEIYELILTEPAHYLKYYVGYLQFEELKNDAKVKFHINYNDIDFHQAVLNIGPAPFDIVEKYLKEYYR